MPRPCTRRSSSHSALEHQLRIALALDVEVAVEHAVAHRAVDVHRRAPGEGRAEQVERRVGRDQLHHRGRVDRYLRAPGQPRGARAVGIGHQQRDVVARHRARASAASTAARQRLGSCGQSGPARPRRSTEARRRARTRRGGGEAGGAGIGRLSAAGRRRLDNRPMPVAPRFSPRAIGIGAAVVTVVGLDRLHRHRARLGGALARPARHRLRAHLRRRAGAGALGRLAGGARAAPATGRRLAVRPVAAGAAASRCGPVLFGGARLRRAGLHRLLLRAGGPCLGADARQPAAVDRAAGGLAAARPHHAGARCWAWR